METLETIYVLRKYQKGALYMDAEVKNRYRPLYLFTLIWTVISVASFPFSYAVFRRFTMLCTVMSIPLVAKLSDSEESEETRKCLFVFSFLIFALSGVRGDLCGYKFFTLS